VGNFVTASQVQCKWYMRAISKVSSGDYKLGVVCDGSHGRKGERVQAHKRTLALM